MTCPSCSGKGKTELFTSARPCERCGGTGKVFDPPTVTVEVGPGATVTAGGGNPYSFSSPPYSRPVGKGGCQYIADVVVPHDLDVAAADALLASLRANVGSVTVVRMEAPATRKD